MIGAVSSIDGENLLAVEPAGQSLPEVKRERGVAHAHRMIDSASIGMTMVTTTLSLAGRISLPSGRECTVTASGPGCSVRLDRRTRHDLTRCE